MVMEARIDEIPAVGRTELDLDGLDPVAIRRGGLSRRCSGNGLGGSPGRHGRREERGKKDCLLG